MGDSMFGVSRKPAKLWTSKRIGSAKKTNERGFIDDHANDLKREVTIQRMKEALRSLDVEFVEFALKQAPEKFFQNEENYPQYLLLRQKLDDHKKYLMHKKELKNACTPRPDPSIHEDDVKKIRENVRDIRVDGQAKKLAVEIKQSLRIADEWEKKLTTEQNQKFTIDRQQISELRRYLRPHKEVHAVVQAVLLMIGYDEEFTSDWKNCRVLLNPQGDAKIFHKIYNYKDKKLHPEIAARVNEILSHVNYAELQKRSKITQNFYVWCKGITTEEKVAENESASIERQKIIFREVIEIPKEKQILGKPRTELAYVQ